METKIEENIRYYLRNRSDSSHHYDFGFSISEFEEILKFAIEHAKNNNITIQKNGFKVYGINNKFFKIFQDGSCFGYSIKKHEITLKESLFEFKISKQQIYNDDFPGLKTYWTEEVYEEIIFKIDDTYHLVFSKMLDIPRNYQEYSIFIEQKNTSINLKNMSAKMMPIISLI